MRNQREPLAAAAALGNVVADAERREVLGIHLRKRSRDPKRFDLPRLVDLTDGFSGAEIEQAIIAALYDAFDDGARDLTTADLEATVAGSVPLSRTMREDIDSLRAWAADRTRPASSAQTR